MTRLMLALAVVTLLSACGIKGDLARPDPLWNRICPFSNTRPPLAGLTVPLYEATS